MNLFKTTILVLGLVTTSMLGINQSAKAALTTPITEANSIEMVDVVLQIDEIEVTPEHPDAANPQPPTSPDLGWKTTHACFNIVSDLISLTSSGLFLSTQVFPSQLLFPLSAAMASGSNVIEFFRAFTPQLAEMKRDPASLRSVCTVISWVGQTGFIVGLDLLAAGFTPEIGAWLATSGGLTKFTAFAIQLGAFGIDGAFGNDRTITNSIFRIGVLSIGGTVGGVLLSSGITAFSPALVSIGIYILGCSGLTGTLEVLVRDIQEVHSLRLQMIEPEATP